jgi:hypothetical protein
MKKCRKPCKGCPWVTPSGHSEKWPGYVTSMESIGKIENKRHACHMITNDTWGYKSKINDSNVCIGSLQVNGNL